MKKTDIETHRLGYGYQVVPAVNVKVNFPYGNQLLALAKQVAESNTDDPVAINQFVDWVDTRVEDDELDPESVWFNDACEMGYDYLTWIARDIYGPGVKVYSEGRSGGWAYIEGIDSDIDSWDAIKVSQWSRFATRARATADDVPFQMLSNIYLNVFFAEIEEHAEKMYAQSEYLTTFSLSTNSFNLLTRAHA